MIQPFQFKDTRIQGLFEISAFQADDARGCFTKDYSKTVFEKNGIAYDLAEVFYTTSHKGVIRAIHFQRVKQQPKLVRCIHGHIYDVVVDLRKDSPTFREWLSFDLSGKQPNEILIPAGCGHGYLVLEDSIVSYKCAEQFYGEYDDGIIWNDPDLAIHWPLELVGGQDKVILAEKDLNLQSFQQFLQQYSGF